MHDAILVGVNTIILDDPRLKSEFFQFISSPKH